MPVDPVTSAQPPAAPRPKAAQGLPAKSLNEADFGALVTQDLKAGLRPGPKMTPVTGDGFKALSKDSQFLPLNRAATMGPASATPIEKLGAATKHPLGPQKR